MRPCQKDQTEIMDYVNKLQTSYIEETDKQVIGWGLMESAYPTISILVTYLFIVYYGPKYMENRKPFNLKYVLLAYNIFQVIFSTYVFIELLVSVSHTNIKLLCQSYEKIDYSDDEYIKRVARCHWLYFIAKLIELLDTIFFVLRKKNNQITILHVYHHVIMAFSWYFVVRFLVIYSTYIIPLINSFVHILMYGYYCLSALGPQMQPYLWWKKYLTKIQMFQFAIIIIHTGANCFIPNCGFLLPVMLHCLFTTIVIAILFANFYYQAYINQDKTNNNKEKKRR
ncbi:hypothetical protein LOTGIDRAFT_152042 [Lottia gigantea]|uniref:Elongation of very long chain fatty acids protein n=1 Tax=Lottia gigantea TaxID=225164 RepID=V4BC55_LOTGI|nr:hypothetical protein LOTGIDRAFT_152042 [Lottia gigantea]ESP05226.1 hypothetical protein LOTGIDRAFT_152042 [Lottia gigantea]